MDGKIERRVRKDGTSSYSQRIEGPPDPDTGKRVRVRVTADTERELRAKSRQAIREIEEGLRVKKSGLTLESFARAWLDEVVTPNRRAATTSGYRHTIERYILPYLGSRNLQDIDHATLQRFMRTVSARGGKDGRPISQRTAQMVHGRLNQLLRRAIQLGYIVRNPLQNISAPTAEPIEPPVWRPDDARRFLEAATTSHFEPFWSLAVLTGMRKGEILGLRWSEVDLENGAIRVMRSRLRVDNQTIEDRPKTKSSRRTIPIPEQLIDQLRAIRVQRKKDALRLGVGWNAREEYVVLNSKGRPPSPHALAVPLRDLLDAAGLERITVHGLRHVHATLMLSRRVNPKIVSERLGHADISITLRIYGHVIPSDHRLEIDDLGAAIYGGIAASEEQTDGQLSDAI